MIILGVEYTKPGILNLRKPDLNRAAKTMLHDTARKWHEEYMPRHFAPGNKARYGYATRSKAYREGIKRREGVGPGKYVALLLSGRSMRAAKHFADISGTSHQATVNMNMPVYFVNPYIGRQVIANQPDKVSELTKVTSGERNKLALFAVERYTKLIQKKQAERKKSKG